jgi:hypothetical protein
MLKLTVRLPGRYCIAGHGTDGPATGKLLSCVLHPMRSRPNSDMTALSIEQDVIVAELQRSTDQGFIARVSSTANEFDREKWSPSGVIRCAAYDSTCGRCRARPTQTGRSALANYGARWSCRIHVWGTSPDLPSVMAITASSYDDVLGAIAWLRHAA